MVLNNKDARRLGKLRWSKLTARQKSAALAALAAARAASGCYSSELQRQRAVAGWKRRKKSK
jgi:hypothetical protein